MLGRTVRCAVLLWPVSRSVFLSLSSLGVGPCPGSGPCSYPVLETLWKRITVAPGAPQKRPGSWKKPIL